MLLFAFFTITPLLHTALVTALPTGTDLATTSLNPAFTSLMHTLPTVSALPNSSRTTVVGLTEHGRPGVVPAAKPHPNAPGLNEMYSLVCTVGPSAQTCWRAFGT